MSVADGFNGVFSVVREISLHPLGSGGYALHSSPVPGLDGHVTGTTDLGDITVEGEHTLPYQGVAYELRTQISWDSVQNAGLQLRVSGDGSRHVDTGVHNDYAYLNRGNTLHPDGSGRWLESKSPFDPAAKKVRMRVLVDRTSVEVFFDDGRYVHSHEVFPRPEDTGVVLYTLGGSALFGGVQLRDLGPQEAAAGAVLRR